MDELIIKPMDVKGAIQKLERFVPTEHNCNQSLTCIQLLNYVAERPRKEEGAA